MSGNSILTFSPFIGLTEECVYSGFMGRVRHFLCLSLSRDTERRQRRAEVCWMGATAGPDGRSPGHIKL